MAEVVITEERVEPAEPNEQPTSDRRSLTQDEVQAIVETSSDPWDKAALVLVFGAGLQVSELAHLT